MKKSVLIVFLSLLSLLSFAQKGKLIKGMYLQWGYNTEWYTHSNIRVKMGNGDIFMLHNAKAHNRPGLTDIFTETLQISIPQYNYRLGFYLNRKKQDQ